MEKQDRPKPISLHCNCGEQAIFITSMLDPKTGRAFHMFEWRCGNKIWILEKA
jgi:hypothetical protein